MKNSQIKMDRRGRLTIPAELRRALRAEAGDEFVVRVQGTQLVLETSRAFLNRMQRWCTHIPGDVSVVEELISERRAEALRDLEETEAMAAFHPTSPDSEQGR